MSHRPEIRQQAFNDKLINRYSTELYTKHLAGPCRHKTDLKGKLKFVGTFWSGTFTNTTIVARSLWGEERFGDGTGRLRRGVIFYFLEQRRECITLLPTTLTNCSPKVWETSRLHQGWCLPFDRNRVISILITFGM